MTAILTRDLLAYCGGDSWRRFGTFSRRTTRIARAGESVKETFTRADATTCAAYAGPDGALHLAAANVLRPHWMDLNGDGIRETLVALIEPSRTNSWVRSDDYTNVAWSQNGLSGVAGAAATAPDGTLTGCHITENAVNTSHIIFQPVTGATDNTLQANSFFVKAAERTWAVIRTLDKNNVARFSYFNLATGVWGTIDGGHTVVAEPWINGWWRLCVVWNVNAGATGPIACVGAATGNNTAIYLGDGASGIYVWRGGWEKDKPYCTSPIATVASVVTRAADSCTVPIGFSPPIVGAGLTVHFKAIPIWGVGTVVAPESCGFFALGANTAGLVADGTALAYLLHGSGAGALQAWLVANGAAFGGAAFNYTMSSPIEGIIQVSPTGGSHQLITALADGTAHTDAGAVIAGLPWRQLLLTIGDHAGVSAPFGGGVQRLAVYQGLHTLAEVQAVP